MTRSVWMMCSAASLVPACVPAPAEPGPVTDARVPALPASVLVDDLTSEAEACARSAGPAVSVEVLVVDGAGARLAGQRVVRYVPERARWESVGDTDERGRLHFEQDRPTWLGVAGAPRSPVCVRDQDVLRFVVDDAVAVAVEVRGSDGAVLAQPPGVGVRLLRPAGDEGRLWLNEPAHVIPDGRLLSALVHPGLRVQADTTAGDRRVDCVALASAGGCPDGRHTGDATTLPDAVAAGDTLVVRLADAETLTGFAWSAKTGGPLAGARVQLDDTSVHAASAHPGWPRWAGEDGQWRLPVVAGQDLELWVEPAGHLPVSRRRYGGAWHRGILRRGPAAGPRHTVHVPERLVHVPAWDPEQHGAPTCRSATDPDGRRERRCEDLRGLGLDRGCLLRCPAGDDAVVDWNAPDTLDTCESVALPGDVDTIDPASCADRSTR